MWRGKRPRIVNLILKDKNKIGGLILPDFQAQYKATVVATRVWYWQNNRQTD